MTSFRWWSLGGLGEVGMNCMLFQFGEQVIPVDAGILFADDNDFGIEALYPNFDEVLTKFQPRHWLITHAHEDHIGAVAAIFSRCRELGIEAPEVLAPPYAAALIQEKIKEDIPFRGASAFANKVRPIEMGEFLTLGEVQVQFIENRHSTLDTCSLAFSWKQEDGQSLRIIHTADFKVDSQNFPDGVIDARSFRVFGTENPDFLFIDSTNSERPGRSVSELDILPGLKKLLCDQEGRVFLTLFSSNIYRMASILNLARECGRQVCLAGRSLQTGFRLATELDLFKKCPDFSGVKIVEMQEISSQPPGRQLIICSGSQGESRSVLNKLAAEQHPHFHLQQGDAVIFSSKTIPGNEKGVSRLINGLMRLGAKVYWGDYGKAQAAGPIHASGHARAGEIQEVMEILQPRHVVPVHGELRQLRACAEIAQRCGEGWGLDSRNVHVVENGTQLNFVLDKSGWNLEGRQNLELPPRILRFGNFLASTREVFLKYRKRGATGGFLSASINSMGNCTVKQVGMLPGEETEEAIKSEAQRWMRSQFQSWQRQGFFQLYVDDDNPSALLEAGEDLARHLRRCFGVRPVVLIHFLKS